MKTPIRFLITLLCAAIASLLIGLALFTPAHAASTPAALTWSLTQYDFGSVPVGQTPSQTFTLSNTLAPGATCTFDLAFTAPAGCSLGDEFHTPLSVVGQNSGAFYILLVAHGFCL